LGVRRSGSQGCQTWTARYTFEELGQTDLGSWPTPEDAAEAVARARREYADDRDAFVAKHTETTATELPRKPAGSRKKARVAVEANDDTPPSGFKLGPFRSKTAMRKFLVLTDNGIPDHKAFELTRDMQDEPVRYSAPFSTPAQTFTSAAPVGVPSVATGLGSFGFTSPLWNSTIPTTTPPAAMLAGPGQHDLLMQALRVNV